jgi:hypothetical protein
MTIEEWFAHHNFQFKITLEEDDSTNSHNKGVTEDSLTENFTIFQPILINPQPISNDR